MASVRDRVWGMTVLSLVLALGCSSNTAELGSNALAAAGSGAGVSPPDIDGGGEGGTNGAPIAMGEGGDTCGNGVVEPGETCDDGNVDDCECASNCRLADHCGDGIRQCDEDCDDGNPDDTDDCDRFCRYTAVSGAGGAGPSTSSGELCGNGRIDADEEC